MKQQQKIFVFLAAAVGLLVLPLVLQSFGNAWVRIADMSLLFVLLSLGLNIVVGYAGLLDLGYVAFFAIGAYTFGLLSSKGEEDGGRDAEAQQRAGDESADDDDRDGVQDFLARLIRSKHERYEADAGA